MKTKTSTTQTLTVVARKRSKSPRLTNVLPSTRAITIPSKMRSRRNGHQMAPTAAADAARVALSTGSSSAAAASNPHTIMRPPTSRTLPSTGQVGTDLWAANVITNTTTSTGGTATGKSTTAAAASETAILIGMGRRAEGRASEEMTIATSISSITGIRTGPTTAAATATMEVASLMITEDTTIEITSIVIITTSSDPIDRHTFVMCAF